MKKYSIYLPRFTLTAIRKTALTISMCSLVPAIIYFVAETGQRKRINFTNTVKFIENVNLC